MKKLTILSMLLMVLLQAATVSAMEIAWLYVQHREYGDGEAVNRLAFGLVDDEMRYLKNDATVAAVTLSGPDGNPIQLTGPEFGFVEEIYGSYDSKNSQWYYSPNWEFDSWFSADIKADLIPGEYLLKVAGTGGKVTERGFTFNGRGDLPVVSADSFSVRSDSQGNLIWTWAIPDELDHLSRTLKTRSRASIDIYTDERPTGYFSIILPAHMGYCFIPREVVDLINLKGERFEFKISLETRDKNNRTYSKGLVFPANLPHGK